MGGDQVIAQALLDGRNHFDYIDVNSRRRHGQQMRQDDHP